jgi:hypothetical protein
MVCGDGVVIGELWDFAPLVVIVVLIACFIVFYVVIVYCASKLLKSLIMSVSNLLVIFWVGNGGELKYFS